MAMQASALCRPLYLPCNKHNNNIALYYNNFRDFLSVTLALLNRGTLPGPSMLWPSAATLPPLSTTLWRPWLSSSHWRPSLDHRVTMTVAVTIPAAITAMVPTDAMMFVIKRILIIVWFATC